MLHHLNAEDICRSFQGDITSIESREKQWKRGAKLKLALLALEHEAAQVGGYRDDEEGDDSEEDSAADSGKGPIHRVEIEAAQLVPSHTGRAQRGFVAHVHRGAIRPDQSGRGFVQSAANGKSVGSGDGPRARFASLRSPQAGQLPTAGNAARPETHVFTDRRDLVSFLRDAFAKSCRHD